MDDRRFDDLARQLATGRTRRALLKGLFGGSVAILATGTGSALAKPNADKKVTVCHYDDDTGQYSEISIAQQALDAHLQHHHGDSVGTCLCTPLSCASLGCGQQQDGCGGIIDCGCCTDADCEASTDCMTNRCDHGLCIQQASIPVDCAVGEWSPAGACSAECGGGTQTWTRPVVTQPSCGGAECPVLSEDRACNTQECCQPIECTVGTCGPQFDTCGNTIGNCVDTTITCGPTDCGFIYDSCGNEQYCNLPIPCPDNYCGGQYDACGHLIGDCGHAFQMCPDNFCGELRDDCGNLIDTCMNMSLQCPDVPVCGVLEDACDNPIRYCGDPHPAACAPNDCGPRVDACGVFQGDYCYGGCTCIPRGGACAPDRYYECCGFDTGGVGACNYWSRCPQGTTCC